MIKRRGKITSHIYASYPQMLPYCDNVFLHQFCNVHIFFHKYAIPHLVSPINRHIPNEVGIGGVVVIDGVSGVGAGGEGSGMPFG